MWKGKLRENSWTMVAEKGMQSEFFQQDLQNKPVVREEIFLQTFSIDHIKQLSVPTFCDCCWNFLTENLSSLRYLVTPRTRGLSQHLIGWKKHRVWTSIELPKTIKLFWDWLSWHWNSSCTMVVVEQLTTPRKLLNTTKKNQKWMKRNIWQMRKWTSLFIPPVTHVNSICLNFFKVEVYINKQQVNKSIRLCAHKSYIPDRSKKPCPITGEV